MVLGKWKRIEYTFTRYNEAMKRYETKEVGVTTDEELEALEKSELFLEYPNWRTTKIRQCSCGMEVACVSFTNTCACGRDYSFGGSELAPRSQWGWETGEHWTDCY